MITNQLIADKAEKALLGSLIEYPKVEQSYYVFSLIKPTHFIIPDNERVYRAMAELRKNEEDISIVTISKELRNNFEDINPAYLTDLIQSSISPGQIALHANIVYQEYSRRALIAHYKHITQVLENGGDVPGSIEETDKFITDILEAVQYRKGREMPEIAADLIQRLNSIIKGEKVGIPTGLQELDLILGGWRDTDLHIIAGRPAMGKTDLALFCSLQAAKRGQKVGFISMEMNDTTCLQRLTAMNSELSKAQLSGLEAVPMEGGVMHPYVVKSINKASQSGVLIRDMGSANIQQIINCSRELVRKGAGMIMIDYLGLIDLPKGSNEVEGLGEVARKLKMAVAKDLNVPCVALHQLNRGVEQRPDKRPVLSDLRGSGKIEEHTSQAIFLYRPDYYGFKTDEAGQSTQNLCELIIAKNRHGITGSVKTEFIGSKGQFFNWDNNTIGQQAPF